MTSPFIGEFCEVRELAERGEGRKEGREGDTGRMFFEEKQFRDGTRELLLTGWLLLG